MRAVVQRVSEAHVTADSVESGRIGRGAVVLLGVGSEDTEADVMYLAGKISRLRIFPDDKGLMNCSIEQAGGDFLVISQFTLYADCRKGNRPSYITAAPPEKANVLYIAFVSALRAMGHRVETGVFQADMQVRLTNDGPVTVILDSVIRPDR